MHFLRVAGRPPSDGCTALFYVMTTVRNIFLTMYAADSNGGNLFIPIRGKSGCGKFSGVPKWRGTEAEKFKGIVRFSELAEGMLYAPIHPTHHVLPLIVRHFQKRLSCEEWAIHDVGRHVAAYYDGKQVTIVRVESLKTDIAYSQDEEGFQQLWRDYYRHMAIRERNNPTAQRSFLPKKYWAYLTEMSGKT